MKVTFLGNVYVERQVEDLNELSNLIDNLSYRIEKSWDALSKEELVDDEELCNKIDYIEIVSKLNDLNAQYEINVLFENDAEVDINDIDMLESYLNHEVQYGLNEYLMGLKEFNDVRLGEIKESKY